MSRNNILVKLSRSLIKFPFQIFRPIEQLILPRKSTKNIPIIIILSLPRSGSTLTYQAIAHSFKVYYLSNLSHFIYKIPYIGYILTKNQTFKYNSDFKSNTGFVKGLLGPAEGFHFWKYWFRCTLSQDESLNNNSLKKREKLLIKLFGYIGKKSRPILTAYLGHLFCVEKLNAAFPNAVFIRIKRDPVDVISSIMKRTPNEKEKVFSLKPAELNTSRYFDKLSKVSAQVYHLNNKLESLNNNNIFDVNYRDLCDCPKKVLNDLKEFCEKRDILLQNNNEIPDHFSGSTVSDPDIRNSIQFSFEAVSTSNR